MYDLHVCIAFFGTSCNNYLLCVQCYTKTTVSAYLQVHFFFIIIECLLHDNMCLFPVAPFAEVIPKTVSVIEGGNITLVCNISGVPAPSVLWTQIGSSKVVSHNSSLTIVNVSRPGTLDNMIRYQCTATNGVETPATATVNVTIHCE